MPSSKSKRIGFVGLSTPLFYDYKTQVSRALSDLSDSPNPILDSPYGLLLLYDELWFLCRSLCPENMRSLPYVRFLDEDKVFAKLSNLVIPEPETFFSSIQIAKFGRADVDYRTLVKKVGIHWDSAADNHTHSLQIADVSRTAYSGLSNVIFDLEVLRMLANPDVEFVTNILTQKLFANIDPGSSKYGHIRLSQALTIEGIPNYLLRNGPYHPCVDEARNHTLLEDFRQWIAKQPNALSTSDLKAMKKAVESALAESQRKLFLKYLDPKTEFKTLGKTIAGVALDFVPMVSGISSVITLGEQLSEEKQKQTIRWQGFVVDSRDIFANRRA